MPKVKKATAGSRGKGPIEKPTSSKKLRAAKSSNTTETSVDDEQVSIAADVSGASLAAASDADSDDSAQGGDRPPSYLFHCAMTCSDDPMITRVLSIPSNFTFSRVHEVMQVAFGWAFSHLWTFEVLGLPGSGLDERRGVLQIQECIEEFVTAVPEGVDRARDAAKFKLSDVFENDQYRGKVSIFYQYDMGDSWNHQITFLGVEAPGLRDAMSEGQPVYNRAMCLAGEGHPCAEDCGGEDGWEDLKELFAKPRMRDEDDKRQWYKTICLNGDPKGLNPYAWSILDVNDGLQLIKP